MSTHRHTWWGKDQLSAEVLWIHQEVVDWVDHDGQQVHRRKLKNFAAVKGQKGFIECMFCKRGSQTGSVSWCCLDGRKSTSISRDTALLMDVIPKVVETLQLVLLLLPRLHCAATQQVSCSSCTMWSSVIGLVWNRTPDVRLWGTLNTHYSTTTRHTALILLNVVLLARVCSFLTSCTALHSAA